jgi:hypothetical protein
MIDDDIRVTDEEAQAMDDATVDTAIGDAIVGEDADVLRESAEDSTQESRPRLVIKRSGTETDEEFPLSSSAVIGRFDPDVGPIDVDLGSIPEGSYVSRKHAKITEEDGVWRIHDLGSSNGTFIFRDGDFQRIEETELEDGDEIALGNARMVFRLR